MRFLFLNSSLEPGRDGVGDYVRELARELSRAGHACALLALHDRHLIQPAQTMESANGADLPILRLPAALPKPERLKLALAFRDAFRPDWISLQFVAYGFDDRGIVFPFTTFFRTLTEGAPLHFMFHELWIGDDASAPLRQRLIGAVQRIAIQRLLGVLKPGCVTTTNAAYQAVLKLEGIEATVLPLFGNVPIAPGAALPPGLEIEQPREAWWIGVFFGALHAEWKPEPLIPLLFRAAQKKGKKLCLVQVGRAGEAGRISWGKMMQSYGPVISFVKLGELPVEALSALLQDADFGIASSPWQLMGKSGTVAAMLDHGLPVLVSRDDYQPPSHGAAAAPADPLLHRVDETLEARLVAGLPKRPAHARLGEIASRFQQLLPSSP